MLGFSLAGSIARIGQRVQRELCATCTRLALTQLKPFAILNSKFHRTHVGFFLNSRGCGRTASSRFRKLKCSFNWLQRKRISLNEALSDATAAVRLKGRQTMMELA